MVKAIGNGAAAAALIEEAVDGNPHANDILAAPAQVIVHVRLEGVAKMLFHRYDCADVEAKGKAGKGSKTKKTDNINSYVYRDDDGHLVVPAENLHSCLALSAKSFQDPRSPRKSAQDLFKAGILVLPDYLLLTKRDGSTMDTWDFVDTRRCLVQQSAVSRSRPGIEAGWTLEADVHILLPNLISIEMFRAVLANAAGTVGLCDFRPRFGRFQATEANVVELE